MSICPKCKEEIDGLENYQSGENHSNFCLARFEGRIVPDYDDEEFQANGTINHFECPKCSEILFTDEDKAISFLKNDELQQMIEDKLKRMEVKNENNNKM